jgi:hypothetical protein
VCWCLYYGGPLSGQSTARNMGRVSFLSLLLQDCVLVPPRLLSNRYWEVFLSEGNGRDVLLTTFPHLVSKMWMSGAILVLPPCAFVLCTGTHLPLHYPLPRFHTVYGTFWFWKVVLFPSSGRRRQWVWVPVTQTDTSQCTPTVVSHVLSEDGHGTRAGNFAVWE